MLPATATLLTIDNVIASCQSPCWIQYIAAVVATPTPINHASMGFFSGRASASAPRTGAMIAVRRIAIALAHANRLDVMFASMPAEATLLK